MHSCEPGVIRFFLKQSVQSIFQSHLWSAKTHKCIPNHTAWQLYVRGGRHLLFTHAGSILECLLDAKRGAGCWGVGACLWLGCPAILPGQGCNSARKECLWD